jgi:hypothetical protein
MTTQLLSFRPSSFTIGIVSNMFDSVDFHTKQLNNLCKLFYLLVVGAGSDGGGLLLYLGSVRHDWSPMKRNLYEMCQRTTRILSLHRWGCNHLLRNQGTLRQSSPAFAGRSGGGAWIKDLIRVEPFPRRLCSASSCQSGYRK